MRNLIRQPQALLAAAVLLLSPALASAQLREVRAVDPSRFAGYPPSAYSGYTTVGPPTYLTSINYPTVYGSWTVGTQWAGPYMSSVMSTPFTSYPSTYSPIAPPAEAAYSQLYYQTGPGGSPIPARAPGVEMSTTPLGGSTNSSNLTSSGPATIDISVPEEADVLIQNKRLNLSGSGSLRHFVTPFLAPGAIYSYDITASWKENGQQVTRRQRVLVRPGEAEAVSFMEAPAPSTSTLQGSRELPR